MGYSEFRHRFLMFPELLPKIKLAKSSNAMLCGRWCQKGFLHWLKSDRVRSRHVSLLPLSHLIHLSPLGSRPQQTHGHVFQAHEKDVYFSLSTAVGSQEVHGEICSESNCIPQGRKTRKITNMLNQESKHVDLTVHMRTTQNSQTGQMNCAAYTPCHHASPCILVCNVSVFVCVCVRVCKLVHHAICHPVLFSVLGFSGCLWVSLGPWLLGRFGQGQQTRNGHESNRHNDHPSLRVLKRSNKVSEAIVPCKRYLRSLKNYENYDYDSVI